MRVRDWEDILEEVIENDTEPDQWRAVGGDRASGIGEDLYLGHPSVGVFHLKTYAKNPYQVQGVGTRVARRIDEDIDPLFPDEHSGRFGVRTPPADETDAKDQVNHVQEVIQAHSDAPTTPDALFEDLMDALESPAYGPMEYDLTDRPEALSDLTDTFEEAEALLDSELDDLIDETVDRGFY